MAEVVFGEVDTYSQGEATVKDSTLTSGAGRARSGAMAKVPWGDMPLINYVSGSGTAGVIRQEMQDGGIGYWTLGCPAALPNGAGLATVVRTTSWGFRVRRSSAASQPGVDAICDGRVVEAMRSTAAVVNGIGTGTWTDDDQVFDWPDSLRLKPGLHTVEAHISANPDGATANSLPLAGWLLPRSDGYRDVAAIPRKGMLLTGQALTTTATALVVSYPMISTSLHLINSDTTAAHTVFIYREDGTTLYDTVLLAIATDATHPTVKDYIFPGSGMGLFGWKLKIDTTPGAGSVTVSAKNQ